MADPNLNNPFISTSQQIKLGSQTFNLVKEMIFGIQPNGQFCMANNAVIKKLGYTHEALLKMHIWDISAEFTVSNWKNRWQQLQIAKTTRFESIWFCKDRNPLAIDLSLHYVEVEGQAYVNAIAHNIDKKIAREDLMSMTYQTLNNSEDIIVWSKTDGSIFYCNEAVVKGLGYTEEAFKALNLEDFIIRYHRQSTPNINIIFATNKHLKSEVTLKKKNGQYLLAALSATLFEHQGEMITCSIFRDITAKQAREDRLRELLLENNALKEELEGAVNYLQEELEETLNFKEIISVSSNYQKTLKLVQDVAPTDTTVLLLGETGTGKELLARAVHAKSKRTNKPLIKINCSALPIHLIESELFGHEKGAFSGADKAKKGRFELAHKGTIFLDEIGELPLELQVKLLRVLQEGEFTKIGATQSTQVDVRIIAATNRVLANMVANNTFRADLYYRLNVFPIINLPLRERKEDIPGLVQHFMRKYSSKRSQRVTTIPIRSMKKLMAYDYPGNIRELENIVERAVILSKSKYLTLQHWQPKKLTKKENGIPIKSFDDFQKEYIIQVLQHTQGKVSGKHGAAVLLKMNAKTLDSKMRKFGIKRNDFS